MQTSIETRYCCSKVGGAEFIMKYVNDQGQVLLISDRRAKGIMNRITYLMTRCRVSAEGGTGRSGGRWGKSVGTISGRDVSNGAMLLDERTSVNEMSTGGDFVSSEQDTAMQRTRRIPSEALTPSVPPRLWRTLERKSLFPFEKAAACSGITWDSEGRFEVGLKAGRDVGKEDLRINGVEV